MQEVFVESSTSPLRPYFASCVLRLARPMSQLEYESFIDLQDKLHQNLCRGRRLVAIGTHDLDTIQGPFRSVGTLRALDCGLNGLDTCARIQSRSNLRLSTGIRSTRRKSS